jgi:hypothetical protein
MNRQQRRAKRKVGGAIFVRIGRDRDGNYYWFEGNDDQPSPETVVHGPFATEAECNESQRLVLLGPQATVEFGGMWQPQRDRLQ